MKYPYPNFLIVGMERSGTLWTSATLNEHPEIASFPSLPFMSSPGETRAGEVHFFNTLASLEPNMEGKFTRPLSDYLIKYGKVFADLVPLSEKLSKEEFYKMMCERYSEHCNKQRGDKRIVGESTPAYVFHLYFIDSLYPGIKKICSIRDPKDKIVSWHFSCLKKGRKTEEEVTEEFALGYLNERIIPEYKALLDYDKSIHCISYEAMNRDPHSVARGLLDYLEVEAGEGIIEGMVQRASFEEMTKRHTRSDSGRKAGEEDRQESLRKGVTGDWKNHLGGDLAQKINSLVGPLRESVFEKYNVKP